MKLLIILHDQYDLYIYIYIIYITVHNNHLKQLVQSKPIEKKINQERLPYLHNHLIYI